MPSRVRKSMLSALFAAALFTVTGCGESHTRVTTGTYAGESGANAPYLNVGPLIYEVQLSRQLNPTNSEDASYLQGLGGAESKLEPGQEWFGVFVQVYNNGKHSERAAETMTISDTQGNVYAPIVPGQINAYAYRGGVIAPKGQI